MLGQRLKIKIKAAAPVGRVFPFAMRTEIRQLEDRLWHRRNDLYQGAARAEVSQ